MIFEEPPSGGFSRAIWLEYANQQTFKGDESGEFPHEVGLFLSYPPEDVQGFIDHRACDFKCAGLWKVYGDEQQAQRLFSRFKHCTEDYCARWQTGWDIDRLAVSTRRAGTQPASDTFRRPGLCGGGKCDTIAAMS